MHHLFCLENIGRITFGSLPPANIKASVTLVSGNCHLRQTV